MNVRLALVLMLLSISAGRAEAQNFSYRGFGELHAVLYPQTAPQDDQRTVVEGRVRVEPAYKPAGWLTLTASTEARLDNAGQVARSWRIDFLDRGLQRSALDVRQASATIRRGGLAVDLGKQFIRWGKTDILTPTDRFAPRDFIEVTDAEFLAVTGVRGQYSKGAHSLDVVWVPFFTPSRVPLVGGRWAALPPERVPLTFMDIPPAFPTGSQFGARWSLLGLRYEGSLSYFNGFNHLPEIAAFPLSSVQAIGLQRSYVPLRMVGADAAVPLPWFTVKAEAASLTTTSSTADDEILYVVQLERQSGELSLVGGYAGEWVTARRSSLSFAPDRGLTRAFLGRASYTIDANRSVTVEAAIRQTVDGALIKTEYSQAIGAHWRATLAGTIIGGVETDFFGQYRRNSHLAATLRYSF